MGSMLFNLFVWYVIIITVRTCLFYVVGALKAECHKRISFMSAFFLKTQLNDCKSSIISWIKNRKASGYLAELPSDVHPCHS